MNKRYQFLLDSEYRKLIFAFEESKKIFQNDKNKNNLLHPGEYGYYRERACKNFLKFILPKKFDVGEGFVINSQNEETTQCDLIIYDSENTPVIKSDDSNRFFPCESTLAIGEVKSILNKNTLFDCLEKLANNKKIKIIKENTNNTRPTLFTFLICESIENFNENLIKEIEDFYEEKKIPQMYKHNFILSLKNGCITYKIDKKTCFQLLQLNNGYFYWETHLPNNVPLEMVLVQDNNFYWNFVALLNNYINTSFFKYYPDPTYYLY